MSYELPVFSQWIYNTLQDDDVLQDLLCQDNQPPRYQQGVYADLAPQVDAVSGVTPKLPYIVFMAGDQNTDRSLCGSAVMRSTQYRVSVWDTANGTVSYAVANSIMDRVEYLLDGVKVTSTTPTFFIQRESVTQAYEVSDGGRVDVAVTGTFTVLSVE
jgi:hypothetical protein